MWWSRTLRSGTSGADVAKVQRVVFADETGVYDEQTIRRVRGWQQANGLVPTGIVDETTAGKMVTYEH